MVVLFYSTPSQYFSRQTEENHTQHSVRIIQPRKKNRNTPNRSYEPVNCSVCPCDRNPACTRQSAECFLASCSELTTNSLFIKHHTFCNLSEVRYQFNDGKQDNTVSKTTCHHIDRELRCVWCSGQFNGPSLSQLFLIPSVSLLPLLRQVIVQTTTVQWGCRLGKRANCIRIIFSRCILNSAWG